MLLTWLHLYLAITASRYLHFWPMTIQGAQGRPKRCCLPLNLYQLVSLLDCCFSKMSVSYFCFVKCSFIYLFIYLNFFILLFYKKNCRSQKKTLLPQRNYLQIYNVSIVACCYVCLVCMDVCGIGWRCFLSNCLFFDACLKRLSPCCRLAQGDTVLPCLPASTLLQNCSHICTQTHTLLQLSPLTWWTNDETVWTTQKNVFYACTIWPNNPACVCVRTL